MRGEPLSARRRDTTAEGRRPPAAVDVTAGIAAYATPDRFEASIRAFEEQDARIPPPSNGIVFVGSSTIVGWHETIRRDLAPLTIIPRGFGGSNMGDILHYLDRVALAYHPRAVALYAGDNDIAQGVSPEQFFRAMRAFIAAVHAALPRARIYVISLKPSPKRWGLWPQMARANALLAAECAGDERPFFINVVEGMLDATGKVREDIFLDDGLHMNEKGYAVWREVVRSVLIPNELAFERRSSPLPPELPGR